MVNFRCPRTARVTILNALSLSGSETDVRNGMKSTRNFIS
jgi:hypothetical protein